MKELKFQLSTALLTIATVAAVVAAAINFEQRLHFMVLPKMARFGRTAGRVQAEHVRPRSGAANAGIHTATGC